MIRQATPEQEDKALVIAKQLGRQIAGNGILCPICGERSEQFLSTMGDYENTLFCPHCEFEFTINVNPFYLGDGRL